MIQFSCSLFCTGSNSHQWQSYCRHWLSPFYNIWIHILKCSSNNFMSHVGFTFSGCSKVIFKTWSCLNISFLFRSMRHDFWCLHGLCIFVSVACIDLKLCSLKGFTWSLLYYNHLCIFTLETGEAIRNMLIGFQEYADLQTQMEEKILRKH